MSFWLNGFVAGCSRNFRSFKNHILYGKNLFYLLHSATSVVKIERATVLAVTEEAVQQQKNSALKVKEEYYYEFYIKKKQV